MLPPEFLLTQFRNISVKVGAATVLARQLGIEAAAQVADVALGADHEDRHLQRAALDDNEADDVELSTVPMQKNFRCKPFANRMQTTIVACVQGIA
jgi:hypothetical protein